MNLYDQTQVAATAVATYRNPNIGDWVEALDPVLEALGECVIGEDRVENISVSKTVVTIQTTQSVRGGFETDQLEIPVAILEAENPVQAATRYRMTKDLAGAKTHQASAQRTLNALATKIASLEAKLAEIG